MINQNFILLGAALSLTGSCTYAYHTLKGHTKPNRVTWTLWALAPLIACAAQWQKGVGLVMLTTFMAGFGPFIVLVASFVNHRAYWKVSNFDVLCGVLSAAALILWFVTGEGNLAIALSIVSDLLAAVPTVIKAYRTPQTEHPTAFRNSAIAASITLLTIKDWTFANYGFAVYVLVLCILMYSLIRFSLGPKLHKKH